MTDLKPCPLCGGEATEYHNGRAADCTHCGFPEVGRLTWKEWQSLPRRSESAAEIAAEMRESGFPITGAELYDWATRIESLCEAEPETDIPEKYVSRGPVPEEAKAALCEAEPSPEAVRVARKWIAIIEDGARISWDADERRRDTLILARAVLKGETNECDCDLAASHSVREHSDVSVSGGDGPVDTVVSGDTTPTKEVTPPAPAEVWVSMPRKFDWPIKIRATMPNPSTGGDRWVRVPVHGASGCGECYQKIAEMDRSEEKLEKYAAQMKARAEKAERERDEWKATAKARRLKLDELYAERDKWREKYHSERNGEVDAMWSLIQKDMQTQIAQIDDRVDRLDGDIDALTERMSKFEESNAKR